MCIIAIAKDRMLTEDEIKKCFQNNSDGAGLAFPTPDGKVHIEKGFMTVEDLIDYYLYSGEIPELEVASHVLHCRTATSGDTSREMTHPFKISELSPLATRELSDEPVLFHNGVIPDWKTLLLNMITSKQISQMPKGPMNDTRMAAIMASLPTVGLDVLDVLAGKFVVVHPSGDLTIWGHFDDVNGVLFSNDGYKRVSYVYRNKNSCAYANGYWKDGKWVPYISGKKTEVVDIDQMTDEEWKSYEHDLNKNSQLNRIYG